MARLNEKPEFNSLIESLRKQGVGDDVIAAAMAEAQEALPAEE